MDKITISNLQGENGLVNVVRYFQNNGQKFLIYSLNEVDEAGYTRLYVAKIIGMNGNYSAETLNDNEWNEVKNLVKVIVKANKESMPVPVQDLNTKEISNILLKDKKVFKLNAPLVNDLSANKPNFDDGNDDTGNQKNAFSEPVQPTFEVPSTRAFETPVQPTFEVPSTPTFETPVQPTFEVPSTPTFETPVQPAFEVPSTPAFETPVQPTFEVPNTPAFETPVQPTFEVPSTPTFETPVQPAFEVPSTPAFDFSNDINSSLDNNNTNLYTDDYKKMYEDVLKKNNELEETINKLNTEIIQYKEIINNVKNIIEK